MVQTRILLKEYKRKIIIAVEYYSGATGINWTAPGKPRDEAALFISSFKTFKWYYFAGLKSMNRASLR